MRGRTGLATSFATLALVLGAGACRTAVRPQPPLAIDPLAIDSDRGPISGKRVEGDVRAFLGIPYAAPPVGDRRWRAPQPPAAWSVARDATRVGPACPQVSVPSYATTSEDCLTLNVWAPAAGAARKPVMVWIPGGAFVEGSGGYQLYDGARVAAREDAIVVTMNCRVGALGFMGHPALAREAGLGATPSFGLLDQQAALAWVRANIARFGGDPEQVTIFGQSAGGWSVCAQLAMPGSRGLFAPVFLYQLTHVPEDPKLHPFGATHSAELWLLFGNDEAGIRLAPSELPFSHALMDAWGRFARTSDPASAELPWPRYTADADTLAVLDAPAGLATHVLTDACAFWDRFERLLR